MFKKLAEEGDGKRSYGFQNEWNQANPKCLQELCMTTTGLVGFPARPLNCTDEEVYRMKSPLMEHSSLDEPDNMDGIEARSGEQSCACNCQCNASKYLQCLLTCPH